MGLHCKTCRCSDRVTSDVIAQWVKEGVKAEGMNYFCNPKCGSCDGQCPRAPYSKRYIVVTEATE